MVQASVNVAARNATIVDDPSRVEPLTLVRVIAELGYTVPKAERDAMLAKAAAKREAAEKAEKPAPAPIIEELTREQREALELRAVEQAAAIRAEIRRLDCLKRVVQWCYEASEVRSNRRSEPSPSWVVTRTVLAILEAKEMRPDCGCCI